MLFDKTYFYICLKRASSTERLRVFDRIMDSICVLASESFITNFTRINVLSREVDCLQVVAHFGGSLGLELSTEGTPVVPLCCLKLYVLV